MKAKRVIYPNGANGILVPDPDATSVTLMVFVPVGSRHESKSINGASHFLEHLMFKGTGRRPTTLDLSRELDRFGAEYNAFTGKDLTAYYIKIEASQSVLAIDLLSDMLFHSRFDSKEMERERGVIVEEINMYEDNPRMHIDDLLEQALFPEHPLGWSIAGPREVIKNVKRDDLLAYHAEHYHPANMTVSLAGKITPRSVASLVRSFGRIKKKRPTVRPFVPFVQPETLEHPILFQAKKTEQVQLGMAFYGFHHQHASLPAAILLSTILGGSMSSRLFIQVRERCGLCYSISASHHPMQDTGVFSILAGLERSRVDEAIRVIWQELQRTRRTPVDREELCRAKDHIRGKLMLAFEDSSARADWYGRQWALEGTMETPEQWLARIDRVTAKDVQYVAKGLFLREKMAAALIGPYEHDKEFRGWFGLERGK